MSQPTTTCPHCGTVLRRFTLPDNTGWHEGEQSACFNDACPYFRRGWSWMYDTYGVKASYRYRIDAAGHASPLPVWSRTALTDRIVEDDPIAEENGTRESAAEASPSRPGNEDDGVIPEDHSEEGGKP